jgi:glycerate 2-kinase
MAGGVTLDPLRDLETIYWDAVRAVDPTRLIERQVKREGRTLIINAHGNTVSEDLSSYDRVMVLGLGKASARMARAMETILGEDLDEGLIITKYGHGLDLEKTRVLEAGHPVPDGNSMEGARMLVRLAREADERTLIINLVSGGGSSLCCLPAEGISLKDKGETTKALLASGATIDEVNCIRKHISKVKGGGLSRIAYPARLISFILSDVVGDRVDTIASGITAPDPTTFDEALAILEKYHIEDRIPAPVKDHLASGAQGRIPETPKAGDPVFHNSVNIILGNNALACRVALSRARMLGYDAHLLTTTLRGEARQAGWCFSLLARDMDTTFPSLKKPAVIITGGETTVTLKGKGSGGRNQEMALAFACELHKVCPGSSNIYFISAGTDGTDGPTDAAGAFVTPGLMGRMKEIEPLALKRLKDNDAYHFFQDMGLLFKTGPTYTNVCDIQILMVV